MNRNKRKKRGNYKCAVTGGPCEGVCKETHLFRKRAGDLEICPVAYRGDK